MLLVNVASSVAPRDPKQDVYMLELESWFIGLV